MESNANFINARNKASETLIIQENLDFPLNIKNIKLNNTNLYIASYQEYAITTNIKIEDLKKGLASDDALVINAKDNIRIILYNEDIYPKGRILWNIAHEMGHIVLNHNEQCEKNEIEANTYASQLLLPQCLLKRLIKNGVRIDVKYLENKFGLSKAASESCLKLVKKKLEKEYDAEYDDIILKKCDSFIKKESRNCRKRYYDEEDNEMEEKRNRWLYE